MGGGHLVDNTYLLFVALIVLPQIIHAAACSGAGSSVKNRQTSAVFTDEPPNLVLFFGFSSLFDLCSGSDPHGVPIVADVSEAPFFDSILIGFGVEVCGTREVEAKGENPNGSVELAEKVSFPPRDAALGVDNCSARLALAAAAIAAAKTGGSAEKCGNAVVDGLFVAPALLEAAATCNCCWRPMSMSMNEGAPEGAVAVAMPGGNDGIKWCENAVG